VCLLGTTAFLYRIFLRIVKVFCGIEQIQHVTEVGYVENISLKGLWVKCC